MNASKTFTALAAAAALVGSIGYASAQQGGDSMPPNADNPANPSTLQQPNTLNSPAMNDTGTTGTTSGTTSTMPSDTSTTNFDNERAPQADRN